MAHKDTPTKMGFFFDYSTAVTAGLIAKGKRSSKRKTLELGKKYGVQSPRKFFLQLKKKFAKTKLLSRRKIQRGTNIILEMDTEESARMRKTLEEYAADEKYKFTFRMAQDHMRKCGFYKGCSAECIRRFMNKPANKWRKVYEGYTPLLTQKHMADRLAYATERINEGENRWQNHFEVDEKWFPAHSSGQKCKLPPGTRRPKKPLQSKNNIGQVMFLVATALPRPDKAFDGKIGFFRVCEMKVAERNSKFHNKGDTYEQDVTMDGKKYRQMMAKQVFPAARKKMSSWANDLRCQQDGAPPHVGNSIVNKMNKNTARSHKRKGSQACNIRVFTQPAQSPDTNINDLAVFPAMSKRFLKKQKHEKIGDLDRLAANARQTWEDMPSSLLTKAWATKTNVMKSIIKAKGGNDFKLPHKALVWEDVYEV
jgi:hypothetical protein